MKKTMIDIISEIKGLVKLAETFEKPIIQSYVELKQLPSGVASEVFAELKKHAEKKSRIADAVILALIHDKIILDIKHLIDSKGSNIDRNLLLKIQENIDQTVQFI